jgi:integration host factor subunit beta
VEWDLDSGPCHAVGGFPSCHLLNHRLRALWTISSLPFTLTLTYTLFTLESLDQGRLARRQTPQEKRTVTKKEIVKQISDRIGLTQLKTKEIVQQTFDAIVDTLLEVGRIELRNFGVFEVKQRKARKARNPRTGEKVDVPPKNVVTFKPGKEMEERVRQMKNLPVMTTEEEHADESEDQLQGEPVSADGNGHSLGELGDGVSSRKPGKTRKPV